MSNFSGLEQNLFIYIFNQLSSNSSNFTGKKYQLFVFSPTLFLFLKKAHSAGDSSFKCHWKFLPRYFLMCGFP